MKKLFDHIRNLFRRLLELRDTPHAIAGGVAIGVFYGFTPLFGVKTLLSLVTAWLARCSKIAAVISVSLHDVVTPLWPFLLRIEYDIGFWILSNPHRLPPKIVLHHTKLAEMLQWTTFLKVGLPLLIGSIVISVPAAILTYTVVFHLLRRRELRRLPPSA
ncbi:MAG: DUF2062 domain-containing protein [Terrimicrobiaceae bacterium]|nr:DUF2062 domain-containing protein [Terrimicrobiaceae bacterium]